MKFVSALYASALKLQPSGLLCVQEQRLVPKQISVCEGDKYMFPVIEQFLTFEPLAVVSEASALVRA